jgi:hypothetical protein
MQNGTTINITKNLAEVLPHLCFSQNPRRIWIDALCINQGNLTEREQQVAIMQDIFRQASKTLLWLGTYESPNDLAQLIVTTVLWQFQKRAINKQYFLPLELDMKQVELHGPGMMDMLRSPLFSRIRIVQEIAACGFPR